MATYYIDPISGSDSYSAAQAQNTATPWRTWAKAVASGSWTAGNSFLQKRGTSCNETPTFQAGGSSDTARITIGAYGSGPKPLVIGDGLQYGIRWFSGHSYLTVQNFRIDGINGSTARRGIGGGGGADNDYIIVEDCEINNIESDGANDCDGLWLKGQGAIIRRNVITNIADDGIWLQSSTIGPAIYGNTITDVAQSGRTAGDCIQLDGNSIGFLVQNNYLDYRSLPKKQVFIVSSATSGYGGKIIRNFMRSPYDASAGTSVIYSDQPGITVVGNWIEGCQYGVNIQAANMVVRGNLILKSYLGLSSNGLGLQCDNNTVINNTHTGLYVPLDDATSYLRNNILQNNAVRGIHSYNTVNKLTNCYYGNGTDWVSAGGGGAIEGDAVLSNPLLDASYQIGTDSPCYQTGTSVDGVVLKDFFGKDITDTPDIGAKQVYTARTHPLNGRAR